MFSSWLTILNIWLCGLLGGMSLATATVNKNKYGYFCFALMAFECILYIFGWNMRG